MPSTIAITAEFLSRLRDRDPAALTEAAREHARPLFRAARAMGFDADVAEDLVQDTFTTFFESLDRFEGRSQLRTWLFGILHRKALERRRVSAFEERTDPIDAVFEARFDPRGKWSRPPADLDRLLISEQAGEMIRSCMDNLPPNQRGVFVLREIEEIESGEICKTLGITITNLGVLMHRARTRLRECLEAKGLTRP